MSPRSSHEPVDEAAIDALVARAGTVSGVNADVPIDLVLSTFGLSPDISLSPQMVQELRVAMANGSPNRLREVSRVQLYAALDDCSHACPRCCKGEREWVLRCGDVEELLRVLGVTVVDD